MGALWCVLVAVTKPAMMKMRGRWWSRDPEQKSPFFQTGEVVRNSSACVTLMCPLVHVVLRVMENEGCIVLYAKFYAGLDHARLLAKLRWTLKPLTIDKLWIGTARNQGSAHVPVKPGAHCHWCIAYSPRYGWPTCGREHALCDCSSNCLLSGCGAHCNRRRA